MVVYLYADSHSFSNATVNVLNIVHFVLASRHVCSLRFYLKLPLMLSLPFGLAALEVRREPAPQRCKSPRRLLKDAPRTGARMQAACAATRPGALVGGCSAASRGTTAASASHRSHPLRRASPATARPTRAGAGFESASITTSQPARETRKDGRPVYSPDSYQARACPKPYTIHPKP
jgi:hypothetical protein